MKKILLSLIFSLSISFGFATNVSGGIYSNTTWTLANSPYIITDTVVVFSGVTLTIEPGVVVKFNNNEQIEIRGNLIANGTSTDSITFTSSSNTPTAGIYSGILVSTTTGDSISCQYCTFMYSHNALYSPNVNGPISISHCKFTSNIYGIRSIWGSNLDHSTFTLDTIAINVDNFGLTSNCTFTHNGTAIYGLQSNGTINECVITNNNIGIIGANGSTITNSKIDSNKVYGIGGNVGSSYDNINNCDISYNGTGIAVNYCNISLNTISNNTNNGIITYYNTLTCNSICNNHPYNIVTTDNGNESIKNNYWCLSDSSSILSTIDDGRTNLSLGLLFFTPFDTAACTSLSVSCDLSVSASATSTTVCSSGGSTTLFAHISDTNTYTMNWTPGNSTIATYGVAPTTDVTYTLVVTDSKGCKDSTTITIDTINCSSTHDSCNLFIAAGATNVNLSSCSSTTLLDTIYDSNTITSVIWNPGNYSGNSYTVSPATTTTYTVTATDNKGCSYSAIVVINVTGSLVTPSICYVTADTTSQHNEVVWSKAGLDTNAIDSVVIFREVTTNNYMRVGSSSIHGYSEYTDLTSNPNNESYYYEIEVKDTCGSSSLSNPAETIQLQSMKGLGSEVDLSWNLYSGNAVDDYRILRDDSGMGNWHIIDSVPGNVGAYTDSHAPTSPGLRYMLNTSWSLSCTPYLPIMPHRNAYHYKFDTKNESYSNITNVIVSGINQLISSTDINVYPNPVQDELSISMHEAFDGTAIITNVLGQAVYTTKLTANAGSTQTLSMSNLTSGVYFLKLESNGQVITKKVIKL